MIKFSIGALFNFQSSPLETYTLIKVSYLRSPYPQLFMRDMIISCFHSFTYTLSEAFSSWTTQQQDQFAHGIRAGKLP